MCGLYTNKGSIRASAIHITQQILSKCMIVQSMKKINYMIRKEKQTSEAMKKRKAFASGGI